MTRTCIDNMIRESAETIGGLPAHSAEIGRIGKAMVSALRKGGKVLTAGNGGSAAEAMHMAEELVGRFRTNRRSLPAIALCADTTALTCIANDFGFDDVFSRQVESLGNAGDLLVLFTTSGNSANMTRALAAGVKKRMLRSVSRKIVATSVLYRIFCRSLEVVRCRSKVS